MKPISTPDAHDEGRMAYTRGDPESANPYGMYPYFNQWSSGWHRERLETEFHRRFIY